MANENAAQMQAVLKRKRKDSGDGGVITLRLLGGRASRTCICAQIQTRAEDSESQGQGNGNIFASGSAFALHEGIRK